MSLASRLSHAMHSVSVRMIQRQEDERTREIVETLKAVPLFEGLARGALRELSPIIHPREFVRNEVIYHQRDPGLGLYIVQHGSVRLLAETEGEADMEVGRVEKAGIFGMLSLFGDSRRLETALAAEDTRVLGLFGPDLKTLLHRSPAVAASVSFAVARYVSAAHRSLVSEWREAA